ncbi:hypothetical protein [Aureimonas pseudogalii]|uniref:Uncharacterized protein n=1 Tax=Aureimonas pseudogalii TaxID=1744844 RepID=A0A7W6H4X2_9HYPH|nr:hypothetical protein [Aureimonas pseudogalii]MBB3998619.1 hypothetical protein [Aureimonas pseudogalii]
MPIRLDANDFEALWRGSVDKVDPIALMDPGGAKLALCNRDPWGRRGGDQAEVVPLPIERPVAQLYAAGLAGAQLEYSAGSDDLAVWIRHRVAVGRANLGVQDEGFSCRRCDGPVGDGEEVVKDRHVGVPVEVAGGAFGARISRASKRSLDEVAIGMTPDRRTVAAGERKKRCFADGDPVLSRGVGPR